ncbi:MAG: hypothetical protein H6658_19355 [Ardenticatenaceae bacterium]|nr:hypothetical protein [Ardenticatenaceae bacterium]
MTISLAQIVAQHPFPDYADWWPMGETFLTCMAEAMVTEWQAIAPAYGELEGIQRYAATYAQTVYGRSLHPKLAKAFANKQVAHIHSGEFDALSYAFFRSAFEKKSGEKRPFTQRVGKRFFTAVHDHLQLDLPTGLRTPEQFAQLQENIHRIGHFLQSEGYLRDHFAFTFNVNVTHKDKAIQQTEATFLNDLEATTTAYALYEMGYPVILPSAVYLYHTLGEAQHHSSRTIEELFLRVGCRASETDDFDPTGFPSDRVVELWEIRRWKKKD